jgi:type IV pilus assembly protein PilN
MRITINLASHPYVELRPIYTRLRIWMLILVLLAVPLGWLQHIEKQRAAAATAHVRAMQTRVEQMQRQQQSYQALMRQPKNAAVLNQSDFLNSLFRQKSFSWTSTMTDLETVLPAGVQVQSIDPQMSPDGHVTIRMRVTGQRDRALELVKNLERSKHFASPRLAGEALATSNQNQGNQPMPVSASSDVNFDILADYRPLPEDGKTASKQTLQQARKGAAE